MSRISYEDNSRRDWGHEGDGNNAKTEHLALGCLQRIANATEKITKRYQELIEERDRYKADSARRLETNITLRRQISGLRGYITRLKRTKK